MSIVEMGSGSNGPRVWKPAESNQRIACRGQGIDGGTEKVTKGALVAIEGRRASWGQGRGSTQGGATLPVDIGWEPRDRMREGLRWVFGGQRAKRRVGPCRT